jgi:hypothetical protein
MSEAVKEIGFIYFILKDIGIEVELPIVVKSDTIGALFMSQNSLTSVRKYVSKFDNQLFTSRIWNTPIVTSMCKTFSKFQYLLLYFSISPSLEPIYFNS